MPKFLVFIVFYHVLQNNNTNLKKKPEKAFCLIVFQIMIGTFCITLAVNGSPCYSLLSLPFVREVDVFKFDILSGLVDSAEMRIYQRAQWH